MSRLLSVLLAVALLAPASVLAQVLYVDADATGAATGASWADAYPDVQSALAAATPGTELWVAEGTYTPTDGTDRTATFQLASSVALYGGFDGTESSRDQRDWTAHETILSGDIGVPGDETDNSYHVVTGSETDASAVLDGFTVTAAYADGSNPRNRGGGMRNITGSPTVRHVVFRENEARAGATDAFGAGMFNDEGSNPTLEDVRFERNVSGTVAGGMANRRGSSPTLRNVLFLENEAGLLAGGMANESGSHPVLVDVQFVRNRSDGWTGGMDNYNDANPSLYNVVFFGNTCANYGGGMTNDTNGDALLVNVLFVGNVAENGGGAEPGAGGLQNNTSSPTLVGVTFVGNTAADGADGLGHRGSGTVTLRNAVLWGNGTELVDETSGGLDVAHAVVQGGFPEGSFVLDADPLFVRLPSGDDYGDLRLQVGSPALDAGDATHLPADAFDLDGDGDTTEPLPIDLDGESRVVGAGIDLGAYEGGVAVSNEPPVVTNEASLGSIYPNPSRGAVSFEITLAAAERVRVTVYDALGRRVATVEDARRVAGTHTLTWNPKGLAAGTYWVRLEAGEQRRTQPLTLLHS